ncbi:high light inducible protein [Prochlorococcus sp. MIT 1223]|uniref:high light inducible protein n=1 Tax=Prochlorococcus sp. MIT 1223 TaxID=3096217 RepID=UPI002A754E42|nr:high light inducible protein [Prochlorococcus sp. MIT 1223]
MTVTKESEGRLNAFAKEPEIELISDNTSNSKGSRIFILLGGLFVFVLISFSITIK